MSTDILRAAGDQPLSRALHSEAIASTIIAGLPEHMDPDQFRRVCVAAFADPAFSGVPDREKLKAVLKCAEVGLYPGAQGHIAFVPRGKALHAEVMFRGYVYLAEQLPHIAKVTPHLVHTSDPFAVRQIGPDAWEVIEHGRANNDPLAAREWRYKKGIKLADTGLRGGYVRIEHVDGSTAYHIIPGARILANMAASRTDSISSRWPERFFRKTVIRAAWQDGVFSTSDERIAARAVKLREFDLEPEPVTRAPSMLDVVAAVDEAKEPPIVDDVEFAEEGEA